MASIIRVKRSTGTSAPSSLNFGELGLTVGVGTHGNLGGRIFAGDNASNPQVIGGRYFTDLLSIEPGKVAGQQNPTTFANGFVPILDGDRKVDLWNVDNLSLDGNTIASTDTDGNIIFDPNGTGSVVVVDDTFLVFGNSGDAKIEYDEDGSDLIQVTGVKWRYNVPIEVNELSVVGVSTLNSSGGITTTGGDLYVGGDLFVQDDTNIDELTARNLNVTGITTFQDKVHLLDNDVAHFGGSLGEVGDLLIFANGSTNSIDARNADLTIRQNVGGGTNDIKIQAKSGENSATFLPDGAVNLFFDNANKLQTRIDGVNINGTLETDALLVTGVSTYQGQSNFTGKMVVTGGVEIDNIGISSNIIATRSGAGNQLYIDPYPDGLSNEGTVIIKGDLQVDGTQTTVNSSSVTSNESIFRLGDVTSSRTVTATVGTGVSVITLDSITGINTGDTLTHASLPGAGRTTVHSYNTGAKTVSIDGVTTAGIATATQIVVTHAFDTNDDRGISFQYNVGVGTANTKEGFFGYDDTNSRWTYVPDATITNGVVSGTKGFLDIKGIFYQAGDFSTNGVVFFDSTGLQNSTGSPAAGISTSNAVLTTTAAGTPTWTDTLDGGTF
tara:strand:- start:908 stop:2740 length:1833 start_codon:yes stop_codon:yes gene_type:complete